MRKIRIPQNSFQFGEVSDSLRMRTDTPIYSASVRKLENMIVTSEGAAKKRHGLKFVHNLGAAGSNTQLFEFEFSDDEQYLISVEDGQVRCFYLDQANDVITLVSTITADTNGDPIPFDDRYINQYTNAQYGDVMFICHPLFMPRMLIRTSLTSFEITPYSFDQQLDGSRVFQPYYNFQPHGATLDPSGITGSITVTTSVPYFTPDHVGVVLLYNQSEIEITAYTSATEVTGTVIDELKIRLAVQNPLRTSAGSRTVEVTHIDHGYSGGEVVIIEDASATGGINTGNLNGSRTVAGIVDQNTWYFTAGGTASSAEDGGGYVKLSTHSATADWSEQSFSAVRGYPSAVVFHENRLCYGGTLAQPDTIWMSQIGEFFNFDVGEAADTDAISIVAATGHVNEIRYMVSNRDLQVFGAAGELYIPTYLNQAITPTNAQIRLQTPFGCNFTQPVSIDGATVFIQNGGNVAREFLYTDSEDAYTSTAISTLASHLMVSPKFMAVSHGGFDSPESYALLSNGNGDLALFSSSRAERRASWSRATTDGTFLAVSAVHDRMFVNILTPSGDVVLCEFAAEIGLDRYVTGTITANYLDVSDLYAVGDVVDVLSEDGLSYYGQRTVVLNGGVESINLEGYTSVAHAGKAFSVEIESNPIDANSADGSMTGEIRGVSTVVLDLRDAFSAKVNNRDIPLSTPFGGKKEYRLLGYNRDPVITISQNSPLPLQVNGFVSEVII